MEDAVTAIIMAFSVIVFVIALSLFMYLVNIVSYTSENILYVSDAGIKIGLLRAITAVPGHVCDGILMGSYLSVAKINQIKGNYELSKKYKILSLVIPVITHGIYDFCYF